MSSTLAPVSPEALQAFRASQTDIIRETVRRAMKNTSEVVHHGDEAESLLTQGLEFTTRMLDSAMAMGETSLLEDELRWAEDRLPHDGVTAEHLMSRFEIYRQVVAEMLPSDIAAQVSAYVEWLMTRQSELMAPKAPGE